MTTFRRTEILLPQNCEMTKWSVVACDQFTSQPEYWAALESLCADVPSTLHLMLPEAYLESRDQFAAAEEINAEMRKYLDGGVFRTLEDSYIYVERTLRSGAVRRGIIGVLDLEDYDYSQNSASPIRATEATVENRLPPRVRVREGAALEMPHIMVFIDDDSDNVMGCASAMKDGLTCAYDFDLSAGGGHIRGWRLHGKAADLLDAVMDRLADPETLRRKYGDAAPAVFAMGDGNHSLATAKKCWDMLKPTLCEEEQQNHPARFSMVEIVNIHDPAITFEPIHKVIFDTDAAAFLEKADTWFAPYASDGTGTHVIRVLTAAGEKQLALNGFTIGQLIGSAEKFCQTYMAEHGGRIDYIHNDDTAVGMGRQPGCAAILLPRMEKSELFSSVISSGIFPKKSFSIGHAEDKRYYLECRRIK